MDENNGMIPENVTDENVSAELSEADIKRKKTKKRLAAVLAVIGAVTVVLLMLHTLGIIDVFNPAPAEDTLVAENYDVEGWRLSPPDWDTDIFTLERYLQKDRSITYSPDGNEFTKYGFDEYRKNPTESAGVTFMAEYFYAAMCGDHEKLNSMHTEAFIESHGAYDEFPMQKIYGIEIVRVREAVKEVNGIPVQFYIYEVNFRIQSNDGKFFRDRWSDVTVPVFYEIIEDSGELKINRMAHIYGNIQN